MYSTVLISLPSPIAPAVAFITGANRGMGIRLVKCLVAKLDYICGFFGFSQTRAAIADKRKIIHGLSSLQSAIPRSQPPRSFTGYPPTRVALVIVVKHHSSVEKSAFGVIKEVTDYFSIDLSTMLSQTTPSPKVSSWSRILIEPISSSTSRCTCSALQRSTTHDLLRKSTIKPVHAMMDA